MIPAALMWGDHAQPQSVAILWLIIRTCVLIFSLFVISRIADTARFVPAALLTILGSTFLLEIHPHLYLMDHTFTFFALASFALCLLDLKLQTWRTAALNAIAAVALLLIKPAALSFLFPEFCVIAVTWILNFFAPGSDFDKKRRLLARAFVYAAMCGVFVLLWTSPYGAAVSEQYQLGERGYWTLQVPISTALIFATLIVPSWLMAMVIVSQFRKTKIGLPLPIVICGILTPLWWYVFNISLTYVADERILASGLAVGVTFCLLLIRNDRKILIVTTAAAALLFFLNVSKASGWIDYSHSIVKPSAKFQRPVQEVGLLPFAKHLQTEMLQSNPSHSGATVLTAVNDEFVEFSSLNLAMRYANGDRWSEIQFQPVPWGSSNFDLNNLLRNHWFLTKRDRHVIELQGDVWTSTLAMDHLINAADSPIHDLFQRVFDSPIHQPEHGQPGLLEEEPPYREIDDSLTLWELKRRPSAMELVQALRWVEHDFGNTPGHAALLSEIEELESSPLDVKYPGLIDRNTADRILSNVPGELRNIEFKDELRLLGVVPRRTSNGLQLEVVWESLKNQKLDSINFVHVLDDKRNIISQFDYRFDDSTTQFNKGDIWHKIIEIPAEKLRSSPEIGLGIIRPPSDTYPASSGPRDWDGHRLIVRIK
jgi:hypothetical protein